MPWPMADLQAEEGLPGGVASGVDFNTQTRRRRYSGGNAVHLPAMPPRMRVPSKRALQTPSSPRQPFVCAACQYASLARTPTTPSPPLDPAVGAAAPIQRFPPSQPPSYKPPEFRKSQLHRQYQSLLRSSPLTLIFQHNNLKATEWMGLRRELAKALQKVDEELAKNGDNSHVSGGIKMQIVQTGIFASAVKVVEFWDPDFSSRTPAIEATDPAAPTSQPISRTTGDKYDPALTHGLSARAYSVAKRASRKQTHGLEPLLSGPLAILSFPSVSPQHLKAALSILSPSQPNFPAPRRKANPAYHEPAVQNGLQKLLLLAARVEGKVFDLEGTKWVGGIEGGLDGLRGQLVAMLGSVGAQVTGTLEAASRSLYVTVEGRRGMLEEGEKEGKAVDGSQ